MEFYTKNELADVKAKSVFQFPTGWNSTCAFERAIRYRRVSIPNGMEFYPPWRAENFRCFARFNSQRDGILLNLQRYCSTLFQFQFPTGWNSTKRPYGYDNPYPRFQFPTGWNSTQGHQIRSHSLTEFQFPTGWNSTFSHPVHKHLFIPSFNSQRDGILHE